MPRLVRCRTSLPAALRHAWLALAAIALLAGGACKQSARLAFVDRILVSESDITSQRVGLETELVGERARAALRENDRIGLVAPGESARGDAAPWHGRVELVYVRTLPPVVAPTGGSGAHPLRAEVAVELTLTKAAGSRIVGEGRAQQEFLAGGPEQREAAFRKALDGALAAAAEQVVLHLETAGRSDEELVAELASTRGERRDFALRVLAERKSPAAVPYLLDRLEETDRSVQLRAVGGLVAVGDDKAVPPLIEATLGRDPSFVIQVVYALGEIGGMEAEAYLFTASNGHPEEMVRQAASEALASLRTSRAATASRQPEGRRQK